MWSRAVQILAIATVSLFAAASSAQVEVPHEFEAGQTARADDVNENFDALEDAATANALGVSANSASITINQDETAANTAVLATQGSSIGTNAAGIAGNASAISSLNSATTANSNGIGTNSAGVAGNANAIAATASLVDANTAEISINANSILSNAADISDVAAAGEAREVRSLSAQFHYFDRHGNDLGVPVPAEAGLAIFNLALGVHYKLAYGGRGGPIYFNSTDGSGNLQNTVYFLTNDCSGDAYIQVGTLFDERSKLVAVQAPDCTIQNPIDDCPLYLIDPTGTSFEAGENRQFESRWISNSCEIAGPAPGTIAATPFERSQLGFPYPIEGPLSIGPAQ